MPDIFMGETWGKGMPVIMDTVIYCPICDLRTNQTVVAYLDIEIHRCHRQSPPHKTYWTPGGKKQLELTDSQVADPTKLVSDFKRDVDRHYLTKKTRKQLGLED